MTKILIKELILGISVLALGLFGFSYFETGVFKKWVIFSFLITGFMMFSTLITDLTRMIKPTLIGLVLISSTFIFQIILVIILFIFLEPDNIKHRITVKTGLPVYLIMLAVDLYWKIKWVFLPKERKRLNVNRYDLF
jgi:hypothetical protein